MALKKINRSGGNAGRNANADPVKLTSLAVGASLVGYIERIVKSTLDDGSMNLIMTSVDLSQTFFVYPAGNVKWMIKDNEIKTGIYTEIVRTADRVVKGKKSTQFDVSQDEELVLPAFTGTSTHATKPASTASAKQAIDRAAITAKANSIKDQLAASKN